MDSKCHEGGTSNSGYLNPNVDTVYPNFQFAPRVCPTCGKCPTCGNGGYYFPQTTWVGPINTTAEAK